MSKKDNPAQGIVWDLSIFYKSIDDPQIAKDKELIQQLINTFTTNYKGKINSSNLNAKTLKQALIDLEEVLTVIYTYSSYMSLSHAKDNLNEEISKKYQEMSEFSNQVSTQLIWFDLEWLELPEAKAQELMQSPELDNYRQHLKHERVFIPHTLDEDKEILLTKKAQTGRSAFTRLYDKMSSQLKFKLKIEGETKELTYSELSPYLSHHPNREVRKQTAEAVSLGLEENKTLYTFILNTILHDKQISDEIRSYDYPQQSTFLGDEIKQETVKAMTDAISSRYDISERFYQLKSKQLGQELFEWDRYSSWIDHGEEQNYSWDQAKDLVVSTFTSFSDKFGNIAQEFFDKNWIDAELNPGKKGGAFCSYSTPDKNPFVLMNYTGTQNDVRTLAHELGHGIHGYLSRKQNLLQFWTSTPIAEIASIFCESVIFDHLFAKQTDNTIKASMLADKLQETFATIFRQNAFYLFESDIHAHRREKGELAAGDFNQYFQSRLQPMFGQGLKLSEGHKTWWIPVAHFYHYNFYVFSYAFGQTLTTALYASYKEQGQSFIDNYIEVLSYGGSRDLYETTGALGIDINDPEFWHKGLKIIDGYVTDLENLVNS